ncbi:MAG TPA: isocitrate lyase/phosphoenolpyruvate mutase family protein [Microlunatus sp.]
MTIAERAAEFLRLHRATEILTLVNCWDVISAKTVAQVPGTKAIATASHAISASYGYPDGEAISADEMLTAVGRIAAAVDLPVTADLEAGYGDPAETVRRAIGLGVVGANLEDQLKPVAEGVAMVTAALKAAESEGVGFVLNARTDAFLRAPDRPADQSLADAIERGKAYQQAGAQCIFVPGVLSLDLIGELVAALGQQQVSIMNLPGGPTNQQLQDLGVARVSIGPAGQLISLAGYADLARQLYDGGALPTPPG